MTLRIAVFRMLLISLLSFAAPAVEAAHWISAAAAAGLAMLSGKGPASESSLTSTEVGIPANLRAHHTYSGITEAHQDPDFLKEYMDTDGYRWSEPPSKTHTPANVQSGLLSESNDSYYSNRALASPPAPSADKQNGDLFGSATGNFGSNADEEFEDATDGEEQVDTLERGEDPGEDEFFDVTHDGVGVDPEPADSLGAPGNGVTGVEPLNPSVDPAPRDPVEEAGDTDFFDASSGEESEADRVPETSIAVAGAHTSGAVASWKEPPPGTSIGGVEADALGAPGSGDPLAHADSSNVNEALMIASAAADRAAEAARKAYSGDALPTDADSVWADLVSQTGRGHSLLSGLPAQPSVQAKLVEAAAASLAARRSTKEWVSATNALLAGVDAETPADELRELIQRVKALLKRK